MCHVYMTSYLISCHQAVQTRSEVSLRRLLISPVLDNVSAPTASDVSYLCWPTKAISTAWVGFSLPGCRIPFPVGQTLVSVRCLDVLSQCVWGLDGMVRQGSDHLRLLVMAVCDTLWLTWDLGCWAACCRMDLMVGETGVGDHWDVLSLKSLFPVKVLLPFWHCGPVWLISMWYLVLEYKI